MGIGVTVFNSDNEAAVPRRRLSHAGLSEPRNSLGKLRMEKSKMFQNKNLKLFFRDGEMGVDRGGNHLLSREAVSFPEDREEQCYSSGELQVNMKCEECEIDNSY